MPGHVFNVLDIVKRAPLLTEAVASIAGLVGTKVPASYLICGGLNVNPQTRRRS